MPMCTSESMLRWSQRFPGLRITHSSVQIVLVSSRIYCYHTAGSPWTSISGIPESMLSLNTRKKGGGLDRSPPEASIWIHSGLPYLLACSFHVSFRWYSAIREATLLVFRITKAHQVQLSRFVLTVCGKVRLVDEKGVAHRNPSGYRLWPVKRSSFMGERKHRDKNVRLPNEPLSPERLGPRRFS